MLQQIQVGALPTTSLPDGQQPTSLGGKMGEMIMAELAGKYYTAAYRGQVFIGSTANAGVVPPAFNATAQTFGIWNPSTSGKNIIPISLAVGLVTVGIVTGTIVYSFVTNAGAQIATGSTISAATLVAAQNANLGSTVKSIANFAPATITTTAPALLRAAALSIFMAATPTAANTLYPAFREDFDGSVIVSPGSALFVAGNISLVGTYSLAMTWMELPV